VSELTACLKGPFTRLPDGRIDCTFCHPTMGDLPFTADANDPEDYGRMIHAIADGLAGDEIAEVQLP
jgi:hypothetical protein